MINNFRNLLIKYKKKVFFVFIILSVFTSAVIASDNSKKDIVVFTADTALLIGDFDLKRGERMFYGLVPISRNAPACADCHYTSYIDTINWNPSGYDIAKIYAGKSVEALIKVVNNPVGSKLPQAHEGYDLDMEQAILLQAYLEKLHRSEMPGNKPVIDNLLLFLLINLIGLTALVDLLFLHKIPYRAIHLFIILGATVYIMQVIVVEAINIGRQPGYAPVQPIKFSHKIHAGDNKIDCQYCHSSAEHSKSAGIPPANLCMNCHTLIVEGTLSGKFEISKISEAMQSMNPIEWVKVHNLPDHVFFSHAQHVGAGKLDCAECHGALETMDIVKQVNDLSMGWCLDCHRTQKVDFENNQYYALFEEYHENLKIGVMDSVLVDDIGGTNCMKCHY
jgi:hypothetical protein